MSQRLLKIYDTNLLEFTPGKDESGDFVCRIDKVYEENRHRLPLDLELSDEGLAKWLRRRTIPRNRAYVENLLAKMGLNIKDTSGVIDICYGLSLNDSFWVTPSIFDRSFAECNLYDNRFDEFVSEVAFSGMGSFSAPTPRSSPEFTTGGMLAKAWRRRVDGGIYLYKTGTTGFANSGNEPYSEYYAAQVAAALGYRHTPYDLETWKDMLCSTCLLWTSIDVSFIPIGRLVTTGGLTAVIEYYRQLGSSFVHDLVNMLIFDAVVVNEDRHYGNFGMLIDSHANRIIDTAPIFDNGLSLLGTSKNLADKARRSEKSGVYIPVNEHFRARSNAVSGVFRGSLLWSGMEDDQTNWPDFLASRLPKAYDDFISIARRYMSPADKNNVKNLMGFAFARHPRHNLPEERLAYLEQMIQGQVRKLIA